MSFDFVRTEEGSAVTFSNGHRFDMPVITDGDLGAHPIILFQNIIPIVDEAFTALKDIGGDRTLSSLGVDQKSGPVKANLVERIAAAAGQVKLFDNTTTNLELKLYELPGIDQSHAVAAIEDREIRDWWRSLKIEARTKMLDQVRGDATKHERLMIALLRAPAPLALLDHETKFMREVWNESKRLANPEIAAEIDISRQHVETARRGLGHLAGIASRVTEWKADTILRTLLASKFEPVQHGFDIFGFDAAQVAVMRQRIKQEAGRL